MGADRLPRPAPGCVDVWAVPVTGAAESAAARRWQLLDGSERRRALALRRQEDRGLYHVSHVALRELLGAYLGVAPQEPQIRAAACPLCGGPHGRPEVASNPALCFSLSHTPGLVVVAIAGSPVGADTEVIAPARVAVDELVEFLHPDERAAIDAVPVARRHEAFLRCWVRKEAYLKGLGSGLAEPLDAAYVGLGPTFDVPPASPAGLHGWQLADVLPSDRHVSAVALAMPSGEHRLRVHARSHLVGHPVADGSAESLEGEGAGCSRSPVLPRRTVRLGS